MMWLTGFSEFSDAAITLLPPHAAYLMSHRVTTGHVGHSGRGGRAVVGRVLAVSARLCDVGVGRNDRYARQASGLGGTAFRRHWAEAHPGASDAIENAVTRVSGIVLLPHRASPS